MNKTIGYILVLGAFGAIAYSLFKSGKFDNVQPAPVPVPNQNSNAQQVQQWQMWVTLIMSQFGNIAALWKPGGPFYNYSYEDVIDYVDPGTDTNPVDWEPGDGGGYGWA